MNDPAVMSEWTSYIDNDLQSAGKRLEGSTFVEVGPGHSLGVASTLLERGARDVHAIDVCHYADLSSIRPDIASRLHYKVIKNDNSWPIADRSADVVYSFFAGEHLRTPADVIHATARALRPDGICIFAIDLEDHIYRHGDWLHFLRYNNRLWDAMYSKRGSWSNRLLAPEWRELFSRFFNSVQIREGTRELHRDFDYGKLAPRFRKYPQAILSVNNLWVVASNVRL